MRLYRFELTHDGEQQGVGLFQGLHDALRFDAWHLMDTHFLSLRDPYIEAITCDPVCCWFTSDGLERYMSDIEVITDSLHEAGWGLCAAVIEEETENAIYVDEHQAIFERAALGKLYDMVNIEHVKDVKTLLPMVA